MKLATKTVGRRVGSRRVVRPRRRRRLGRDPDAAASAWPSAPELDGLGGRCQLVGSHDGQHVLQPRGNDSYGRSAPNRSARQAGRPHTCGTNRAVGGNLRTVPESHRQSTAR